MRGLEVAQRGTESDFWITTPSGGVRCEDSPHAGSKNGANNFHQKKGHEQRENRSVCTGNQKTERATNQKDPCCCFSSSEADGGAGTAVRSVGRMAWEAETAVTKPCFVTKHRSNLIKPHCPWPTRLWRKALGRANEYKENSKYTVSLNVHNKFLSY